MRVLDNKTEKNVRATRCSAFLVACTTFANVCTRNLCKKSYVALKESVAITRSTNCDLAIECLGVRAIECLDGRVATIVVRMSRRKIARNKSSNFDSTILIWQSFIKWSLPCSLILRNVGILSSVLLSKTCESVNSGFVITSSIAWGPHPPG